MKKILYITNGINGPGGLERVLSIKASLLADEYPYEVHIMSLNDAHLQPFYQFSEKIHQFSIEVGGNPLAYIHQYKKGIQQAIDNLQPDIISVCDNGIKAFLLPKIIKTQAKWIYERHNSKLAETFKNQNFLQRLSTKSKWFLMDRLGNDYDAFVVLSEGNKKEWRTIKTLRVISNPLSFYPEESSKLQKKTVISVGKISYQKGQDLLVKSWKDVNKKYPDWKLEIYGSSTSFMDLSGYRNQGIFHYEATPDIQQKYLDSSIYVMSSRFEGFGMVLIEAMACGLPCISFDCNYGPSDIIENGSDGFLVENGNTNNLTAKIIKLIEDKDLRSKMGSTGKINVKQFSPKKIVELWDNLFQELIK